MKLLVLGGTVFLGRHIASAALTHGHEVTLFNRGIHSPGLFPDIEKIIGDRDGDIQALKGRQWDAVIDTSGYVPRIVRDSAECLKDQVNTYTFISSISVYHDFSKPGMDESAEVGKLADEQTESIENGAYGALKALCEKTLADIMPNRSLVIRPGLIVGPHDPTDRFTYWPHRVAKGGDILTPGNSKAPVQFIDVRDLAEWIVKMTEASNTGVYHATGPKSPLTMAEFLKTCRETLKGEGQFNWVTDTFLEKNDVTPWTELPLWIPKSENMEGFQTINASKAINAGLTFRPLTDTIRDTWEWAETRKNHQWKAGIPLEKEQALLLKWSSQ